VISCRHGPAAPPEARIADTRQVLIVLSPRGDERPIDAFAGTVVTAPSAGLPDLGKGRLVSKAAALDLSAASRVLVIREGSHRYAEGDLAPWPVVGLGRVPIHVHGRPRSSTSCPWRSSRVGELNSMADSRVMPSFFARWRLRPP